MAALRSLVFALVFYGGSIPIVLTAPVSMLFGREALRRHVRGWARFHRWWAAALLGIRARVQGAFADGPALYAIKHQSMFETIEIVVLLPRAPAIVMKRQLLAIPVWGPLARAWGAIPVDRGAGAAALRTMLRAADAALAEGRPIVIFPEGTRVAPGEAPPLQPGFAGLYKLLKLPVVPVALDSGRLWPRRSFVKRPGIVTVRLGEPVPPGLPRGEVEARVHAAINALEPA